MGEIGGRLIHAAFVFVVEMSVHILALALAGFWFLVC
jgi:hypothetical protein